MTHPRVEKLYQIAAGAGLDAIALIPGSNLHYVTGQDFHLMERPLVTFFVPGRDPVAVVPVFEEARLLESGIHFQTFPWSDFEGPGAAFAAAAGALRLGRQARIGVEELRMRVLEAEALRRSLVDVQLIPSGDALARLRLCKDSMEIATLREAIAISEAALKHTLKAVAPGMTEREVTSELVIAQLQRGGGKHPFEPIVLAGPKSALPHGEPGEWRIKRGAPLLFDFGTTVRGYVSDITRTFSIGEPSVQFKKVYALVKAANEAGRAAARPGATAQDVDRATRQVIEAGGYGSYFTHRTGHGLGLDAHEDPHIVEGNLLVLEPGMVFTIEPGIYIPGEFGVRIEDNVVITDDGAESLTTFPRDLQALGE